MRSWILILPPNEKLDVFHKKLALSKQQSLVGESQSRYCMGAGEFSGGKVCKCGKREWRGARDSTSDGPKGGGRGSFRKFQENPFPFCPAEGHLHEEDLQTQIGKDHEVPPGEDVRKSGSKTIELAEVLQEIGQGDEFSAEHDPLRQDRDRIVDPADEEHEAHEGPGRDLGPVSEDEDQDRHQHPNHRPIEK